MRSVAIVISVGLLSSCALSHERELELRFEEPCSRPAAVRTDILLGPVHSAAFVGSYLHIAGEFDGRTRYGVFAVAGQDLELVSFVDLDGPASWVAAGPDRHVRVRDSDGGLLVEVLDSSVPSEPWIADGMTLPGSFPPQMERAYGATGDRVFICAAPEEEDAYHPPGALRVLALEPLTLVSETESRTCGRPYGRIERDLALTWKDDGDGWVDRLDEGGSTSVEEYLYNPDGIHQYGSVRRAYTDGHKVVMDPESPREFFLFDADPESPSFMHALFGGGRTLVEVQDERAYFIVDDGLRSFELDEIEFVFHEWVSPPRSPWHRAGEIDSEATRRLAATDGTLVLLEGTESLFVVPLTESGSMQPAQVVSVSRPEATCEVES